MYRYKITLEYIGTKFHGWQRQKSNISVQETFEKAAEKIFQEKIYSTAAGRTDAGVHAQGQVVHLDSNKDFDNSKLLMGLNFYLLKEKNGSDISVKEVKRKSTKFHARFSVKKKHYQYKIFNSNYRSPLFNSFTWWIRKKLDVGSMKIASKYFIGNNNFTSFRAKGCQANSPIKTIKDIDIVKFKNVIILDFYAKSFLYNQVRIMVGTLRDVGLGFISQDEIIKILNKKNRNSAGITAPAKGLTLMKIFYR